MIFNRAEFEAALYRIVDRYEKTAPTVAEFADDLYRAKDDKVTLADLAFVMRLDAEPTPPNYAANETYHHMIRTGRDTTGHAGF